MQKKQDTSEFISKFIIQLEMDNWLEVTMLSFPQLYTLVQSYELNMAADLIIHVNSAVEVFFKSIFCH